MAGAAQFYSSPNAARGLQLAANLVPHGNIGVRVDITDKVHTVLGATQQDVDPVDGTEKPDFAKASSTVRHLVLMRLRSSALGWDIPEDLRSDWHDAFESTATKAWHLEPMPGDAFPLRKYTN
ncbi:Clavaminate synthase-like protein [Apiospora marii]|uniref:Clavaminate synthase-like protein n=1 Tax=Apiospora marii TaxID=335849 RepID=UPI00312E3DDF